MKLISLDAVLAKIDKRIKVLQKHPMEDYKTICHLDSLKQSINSIKVKEVDLEKELDSMITPELKLHKALPSLFDVAKHFFELGVNTNNSLTWEDIKLIWNITDEMDNMPEEEFYKEVLKQFKAQKGE